MDRSAPASATIFGSFRTTEDAQAAFDLAKERHHLLAPTEVVGRIPEGCEIAITEVPIDANSRDVYLLERAYYRADDVLGIDKVGLHRILAAAGGTWKHSRQVGDRSHPHRVFWETMVAAKFLDGSIREGIGNVEEDLRDESPRIVEIKQRAAAEKARDGGEREIREARRFVQRNAETKAMNRAIAFIVTGLRRSYKRSELRKTFAVARVSFTGHSEDPVARAEFRAAISQSFLGSSTALYGKEPAKPAECGPAPKKDEELY